MKRSPPKLSEFADPNALPRVRLKEGRPLPLEAMRNLLEMLQFTPVDPPYAGLAQVREVGEPGSLDELVWALAQSWERAGGSSANAWALHALGHLGGDAVVKKLVAAIRRWPREKGRARALLGLDVLACMGTDVALLHLDELAKKGRNKQVEAKAAALLVQVAEARGLSAQELEDRLVPTLELDAAGGRSITIGQRVLTVRFDERLVPHLVDAQGARVAKLLKAKGDDPEALQRAKTAWKELEGDAAVVAKALVARLERSMCDERRWDVETFDSLFVRHPLVQHLSRRLVWGAFAEDDTLQQTFRLAEDRTLADTRDEPFALDAAARVGIVHPLRLDPGALAAWGDRLADYEILQPFEQLGRRVTRAEGDGRAPLEAARGRTVPLGTLVGVLESRGWRMASPDGDGIMDHLTRPFGKLIAYCSFGPGFRPREPRPPEVEIGTIVFQEVSQPADAPAIAYSELIRDLALMNLV